MLSKEKIFYVYAYLDPRKPYNREVNGFVFDYEPFYIGKGHGNRMFAHFKEYKKKKNCLTHKDHRKLHKINNIVKAGLKPIIKKIVSKVDEASAFDIEDHFIDCLGTKEKAGPLFNYRGGGANGGSLSDISKEKIKKSLEIYYKENGLWNHEKNCRIPWNLNVPLCEEAKDNLRKKNLGKKQSSKTIEKRAKKLSEIWKDRGEEIQKKRELTQKKRGVVKNYKEIGKRISKTKKGNVVISENQKRNISETLKNKYKNGDISVWCKGKKLNYKTANRRAILQIDSKSGEVVNEYETLKEATEKVGITISYYIRKNKSWCDFTFKYKD